jgi:hypothetical protein
VISKAAALVVRQLNAAKKRINAGKQEIKNYVASLPKNLQKVGADAAKKVQNQFADLESSVNNKQNELVDSLADKYKAGLQNVDKKIEAMKEANKGLIDRAKEAISEVIDAIIEFKNLLLNVLAKAAEAIDLILDDPIGFLGNLIAGVKGGIQAFMARIGEHLKAGLMGWLFGTLASAGIKLPESFDLKGILSLILQVLGLTYANIRARAVNILGERVVAGLEKAAEVFIIVKNEGIGGLWRFIKEKVEDLKDTVINSIKEFVIQKIVVAGITWIISLLNPASAFIKACKLIYDVIMFFVTRAKQIVELINAVVDSVTAIARGAIQVAANAVENALAKALPVALGFLASLLGLDGISDKIKAIIAKIQAPINAAIDWVINKAVALVKAAGKLFMGGKDKDKDKAMDKEDDDKSKAVKNKVKSELAGKNIKSVEEEETLINSVYNRYSKEGLKGILFKPSKDAPGAIDVIVSASLAERVAQLNLNTPEGLKELASIGGRMSVYAKRTTIFVFYDTDHKKFATLTQKGGHAEHHLKLRFPSLLDRIQKQRNKLKTPIGQPVPVHLDINRTPCDGCATSHLIEIINNAKANYKDVPIALTISSVSISSGAQLTTEKGVASLLNQGVELTSSMIWSEIKKQMLANGIKQFEYGNKVFTIDDVNAFIAEAGEVQELIDKVVANTKKSKPVTAKVGSGVE